MQGLRRVPVSYVWAYRDVPDDALAVLSVVRRARCTELLGRRIQLPTVLEEVTHLGAAPLNLKGKSFPFATTAPKGFPIVPLFYPSFCLARPKRVFDLAGSILLSLEFARANGSKDSTSKCIVFCLRRGVVSAAPLLSGFVDFSGLAAPEF
ncbi:hypothetical protein CRG98_016982 [Punica granatum]|uniref:Uncharacterized protein n=1 Tax=Punica granatum TaxID=22663 RepID=A0A2I0K3B2_PUNGR|nr:hypothetical protein CRG98_016982 [Punica granatum]